MLKYLRMQVSHKSIYRLTMWPSYFIQNESKQNVNSIICINPSEWLANNVEMLAAFFF